MSDSTTTKREYWIDYLRILASFGVVSIHVTVPYYERFGEINLISWWIANIINCSSQFAVPLFLMISGYLSLGKPYSIQTFYSKRIPRLLYASIFWGIAYCLIHV